MESLGAKHTEASRDYQLHLGALQGRFKMLTNCIDRAYEDKLAGTLPEDMSREKNTKWLLERDSVQAQINSITEAKDDYIEKGVLLLERANVRIVFIKMEVFAFYTKNPSTYWLNRRVLITGGANSESENSAICPIMEPVIANYRAEERFMGYRLHQHKKPWNHQKALSFYLHSLLFVNS